MNRLIVKLKVSKRGTILTLAAMLMLAAAGGAGGLLTRDVVAESVDITADIKPTLQVLLPADNILLNLSPEYNLEAFNSQDYSITVGTNSITGYNLTLTADSTDLTRTETVSYTHLPLALQYTASYIQQHCSTYREYLDLWDEDGMNLFDEEDGGYAEKTVRKAFHITLDKIKDDPIAMDLLHRLACLNTCLLYTSRCV